MHCASIATTSLDGQLRRTVPMHHLPLFLLISCSGSVALQLSAPRAPAPMAVRAPAPAAFFGFGKKESRPTEQRSTKGTFLEQFDPQYSPDERKARLETGTNWVPRTSTVKGEGYQFFQGPTPKTGDQGLASFFDFEGASGLSGVEAAFAGVAAAGTLGLAIFLVAS